ncbi:MAG TPA: amino acid adenylation domain-containing protein, partial [Thermoanaerobaculia bacterium]
GLLGILKAGGAYVPLDPAYPADRLRYILDDSAPVALLECGGNASAFVTGPDGKAEALPPHSIIDLATVRPSEERPSVALTPNNLAYIIYTSGSTGMPKGVMVEHRNVARLFTATDNWFHFDHRDVWTMFHSYAFDFSVWEIWGALLYGGKLVVVPQDITRSPDEFYQLVCDSGTTILNQTPSAFRQFIAAQKDSSEQHRLRHVIFGGEALEVATLEPWFERNGDQSPQLVNMYGITETTVHVTYCPLDRTDVARGGSPIGSAIPDLTVYLLDAHREPVPVGVVGELYIGGAGVARGYLNRPELTAERFLANPFAEGTMYKSGDLGRLLADGSIEFIGRNDAQVKIRGFRIELGEIEAKLAQCEGVREAVVIAREDVPGDQRLVAYVIWSAAATLPLSALRETLSLQLPEYMVPGAFVQLESLPLTTNGKLDRKALPAPEATSLVTREYEAPQGETEQKLAAIWQELLRIDQVGRHDRFFELGGHSLLAMQLTSHLRAAFGVELPLRQIFASPTLSAMAEVVRAAGTSTMGRIERADRNQPLPLSLAQQRLWFLDQLDQAASASYAMTAALRLRGKLDVDALQATLDRLVARHEVLRTSFPSVDGVPYQQIAAEDCGFALKREDCTEADIVRITDQESRESFDLATGPMIRGRLLRVSDDEHVLLVTQHHIITDGWSIDVMVSEVGALYAAFLEGNGDPLPPLELQYADYAQWQREWLQGEELARQLAFWKEHLAGAPALLELPLDRPRPVEQSHAGAAVPVAFTPELTASLRAFSQRHGVTLYMTLLSAWGVLLSRLSGQADVVIGTPVANRQRQELENLIGFFVNMLAVRLRVDEKPSFASLLAQVKETTLAAFAHQDLPFEQVVEAVQPQRSLSHSPLAQVTFTWNNLERARTDGSTLQLPGLTLESMHREYETIQVDLQMLLDDGGDVVTGTLVYARDLFDRETIERWTGHFVRLLEAIAADASMTVDALPLLTGVERDSLLAGFNDTSVDYPSDALIHQLFEKQAAANPDAIAVVYEDETLTYAELNARANQLAHYLIGLGVQPDDRVAICTERNTDLIVGLLGILKAGGSYLPLDPSYPQDRLAWMLEDASPVALLVHSDVADLLPETDITTLRLDIDVPVLTRRLATHNPQPATNSRSLAYVIYTSGSTGTPKGVAIEHRNVNRLVINNPYFSATSDDCIAHCANPAFDAATWEIWGALLNGARLLVVPSTVVMDSARLDATLSSNGVTALWLTVGLFNQYVDQLPDAFARLRYLLVGGDALDPRTIRQLLAREQRPAHVVNGYGPTETTTFAITHDIREVADDARSIPLGKPIANTQIYILDA